MAEGKAAGWSVTSQQETIDMGPAGTFVQGVRVSFRTASGAIGQVFVPTDQYTPDQVARLVNEKAATMETVAKLTG